MKRPVEPYKPGKPRAPDIIQTVCREIVVESDMENCSLAALINRIPEGCPLEKAFVDGLDIGVFRISWSEDVENKNYDRDMAWYRGNLKQHQVDLGEYKTAKAKYDADFAKWEAEQKKLSVKRLEKKLARMKEEVL